MIRIEKKNELSEKQRVYELLKKADPTTKEYRELLELYERLNKLDPRREPIKKDTYANIAANLLGIGLILNYERLNVISTKAINFVVRGRL